MCEEKMNKKEEVDDESGSSSSSSSSSFDIDAIYLRLFLQPRKKRNIEKDKQRSDVVTMGKVNKAVKEDLFCVACNALQQTNILLRRELFAKDIRQYCPECNMLLKHMKVKDDPTRKTTVPRLHFMPKHTTKT